MGKLHTELFCLPSGYLLDLAISSTKGLRRAGETLAPSGVVMNQYCRFDPEHRRPLCSGTPNSQYALRTTVLELKIQLRFARTHFCLRRVYNLFNALRGLSCGEPVCPTTARSANTLPAQHWASNSQPLFIISIPNFSIAFTSPSIVSRLVSRPTTTRKNLPCSPGA
jgi:hypothetical protein